MKKLLSLALVLAMVLTSFTFVSAEVTGTGTEDDPYLIYTWEDFQTLDDAPADTAGKYYKLMADIDIGASLEGTLWGEAGAQREALDSAYMVGTTKEGTPVGFRGVFDGNGHKFHNFAIDNWASNSIPVGIFNMLEGEAVVKNLGVEDVIMVVRQCPSGNSPAGAIAGRVTGSATVENCYVKNVDSYVTITSGDYQQMGGMIGNIDSADVTVNNCYSVGGAIAPTRINHNGDLIGYVTADAIITNCYAQGWIGKRVGTLTASNIKNNYSTKDPYHTGGGDWNGDPGIYYGTVVTEDVLKTKAYELGEGYNDDTDVINGSFPVLDWQGGTQPDGPTEPPVEPEEPEIPPVVEETPLIEGLKGEGTATSPVLISSEADWETFATALNADANLRANGNYYKLTADLDFADYVWTTGSFAHINDFKAELDGDNHTVSNFTVGGSVRGLIYEALPGSVIKNLGVKDVTFSGVGDVNFAAIAGRSKTTTFENCFVYGVKDGGSNTKTFGGLVGTAFWANSGDGCKITDSYVVTRYGEEGYIDGTSMFGGIIGDVWKDTMGIINITNCYTDVATVAASGKSGTTYNVTNSYYVAENTTAGTIASVGEGKNAVQLKALASTLGTAFVTDEYEVNSGYPIFTWQYVEEVIDIKTVADLSAITVEGGTLKPEFDKKTTSYKVAVAYEVDKISIAATAENPLATVVGGGTDLPLEVGKNTFAINVTSEDGQTTKTYTVVVTRAKEGSKIPEDAPADAIIITNVDELKAMANGTTAGKYYVLMEDIDLKDDDWSSFIGTANNPFKGTFDGNSHAIRNFKIKNTGASNMGYGIFGYVDGDAVIKNVGVENVEHYLGANGPFYSHSAFGGLVGFLQGNAKVLNCFAKNVKVDTKTKNSSSWSGFYGDQVSYAGGLIGTTVGGNCEIENCYVLNFEEIDDSSSSEGGLVGGMPEGTFKSMKNCYSNTHLASCNANDVSKIVNCYAEITTGWSAYGKRPGITVTDADLKNKAPELGEAFISDIQSINNGYPMLAWEMNLTRLEGNGTEETPFLISDVDTLAQVAGHRDTAGKFYQLTDDIDFEGAKLTAFIGSVDAPFKGTFDGNGHIIKNFVIETPVSGMFSYLGVFAAIGGEAIVKNIGVVNATICPAGDWGYNSIVGGLVAIMYDGSSVVNCFARNVTVDSFGKESFAVKVAGGLVGTMKGANTTVKNCYATGITQTSNNCGSLSGVVGTAESFKAIENCYSDATLTMVKNADLAKTTNSYYVLDDDATAFLRTGTRIKAAELSGKLSALGSAYVADTNNINNGYPIQKWETGMKPDDVVPESAKVAALKSITLSKGSLVPAFDPDVTEYEVEVENTVTTISVTGAPSTAKATVTGSVTDATLEVGVPYVVTLVVTSQDKQNTKTYTITITRQEPPQEPGIPEEPIQISSVDDLKKLAGDVVGSVYGLAGYKYELTTDLDLGGEDWNSYTIGTAAKPFKGSFDGKGHTISNFKFNVPTGTYKEVDGTELDLALFGALAGDAVVKNLGVADVDFYSTGTWGYDVRAAGFAAKVIDNVKIDNCFARNVIFDTKASSSVQLGEAGAFIGILKGANVEITNCYETGYQEINDCIAQNSGFIGRTDNVGRVENCYSSWNITGCLASLNEKFINCYCLDNSQWHATGNRPGILVTEIPVLELGSAFAVDGDNINGGHPVLAWEPGATEPEIPVEPAKVIESVETTETEVVSVTLGLVEEEAYLIVALYNGNTLIGQKFIEVSEAGEVPVDLTIGGADTVKVFVMTSGLMPLTAAEVITK